MSCRKGKKSNKRFLKNKNKFFIAKLILKIYTPSLLIVIKINILDFILSIYLV